MKILALALSLLVVADAVPKNLQLGKTFRNKYSSHLSNVSSGALDYLIQNILPSYLDEIIHSPEIIPQLRRILEGTQCLEHLVEWIAILSANRTLKDEEIWALHMADAYGKPPEGLLSGHINLMGDYDECVGTRSRKNGQLQFRGRYCTLRLIPQVPPVDVTENSLSLNFSPRKAVSPADLLKLISIAEGIFMIPSLAVCAPSTCSQEDVVLIAQEIYNNSTIKFLIPNMLQCYTDEKPPLDAGDISIIVLLSVIFFLCALGTFLDLRRDEKAKAEKGSVGLQVIIAFSVYTNVKKFLNTRKSADDLGCLHGLRFFSTSWVVLGHTWYMATFIPQFNMVDLKLVHEDWKILTILNATVAVDTFFVISGLLVTYSLMKMFEKAKAFNPNFLPMFYIHRYLRLTPTYLILLGIMATLVPYVGSGPYWNIMDTWSHFCEKNWWTNILYLNNFINVSELCQGEAWYLAVDFQLYILAPFVVYPLWKYNVLGSAFLGILMVGSIIAPGLMVYFWETTPTSIGTRANFDYYPDIYIKPYGHAQSYIVGMWLGFIFFKTRGGKIHLNKLVVVVGWLVAAGTALAVLYGIHPYFDPTKEIPRIGGMIYGGLNRFAWSVAVAWVVFACVKGYGGFVNTFLSWKGFMPLGRTCFCVYLISLHLQMIFHLSFQQPISFKPYTMTNFFFAHMMISFFLGFIATIAFESPFIQIEKLMFSGVGGGSRREPKAEPPAERNGIFYNKTETILKSPDSVPRTEL